MKRHHCNYCHQTVSPNASYCPSCGEPKPVEKNLKFLSKFLMLIGCLATILSMLFWGINFNLLNIASFLYFLIFICGISILLKGIQLS